MPEHGPSGRIIRLTRHGFPSRPGFDTAVSRALLNSASDGRSSETLRLWVPAPIVAFGKRDLVSPGYAAAVTAAREGGFTAVERLAGGRAAVFHPGTIAFAWTLPSVDPPAGIHDRFREISGLVQATLEGLGIDARIGEVSGEYCPGEFSVNAGGARKLMGVGQRLARHAAHVGGVIVVNGADRVRDVLVPVYAALGIEWDPETVGAVDQFAPRTTVPDVMGALATEFATTYTLEPADIDPAVLRAAEVLAAGHLSPPSIGGAGGTG